MIVTRTVMIVFIVQSKLCARAQARGPCVTVQRNSNSHFSNSQFPVNPPSGRNLFDYSARSGAGGEGEGVLSVNDKSTTVKVPED